MNAQTFTLRNPRATRTGHVHYVSFRIEGDRAVVLTDDCSYPRITFMDRETARGEYRSNLDRGFVPYEMPSAAREIELRVAQINEEESRREAYKASIQR